MAGSTSACHIFLLNDVHYHQAPHCSQSTLGKAKEGLSTFFPVNHDPDSAHHS